MFLKKLTSIIGCIIVILFWGCSSTQVGVRQTGSSYQQISTSLATRIEKRLSDFDVNVRVTPALYNRYDITVSWTMNTFAIHTLLNSNTKDETIGVVVGMMIVMAAVVGDEAAYDYKARDLIYQVNGIKFASIPISKCRGFMSLVVNKRVDTALDQFVNSVTLLN